MKAEKRPQWHRWGIFNLVGALGFAWQLTMLFVLTRWLGIGYLPATAIAVEVTLLHNFAWHEHLTWADTIAPGHLGVLGRLVRFHIANGLISIAGNVALTWVLVKAMHWHYLLANGMSVAVCSLLTFIAGDRLVFRNGIEHGCRVQ